MGRNSLKLCCKCEEYKRPEDFGKASGGNYLRTECKACHASMTKIRRALKKKYGDPPEGHRCPICEKGAEDLQTYGRNKSPWVIDHDHTTGKFRGWLCHRCNIALGGFNDSILLLSNAKIYLRLNYECI